MNTSTAYTLDAEERMAHLLDTWTDVLGLVAANVADKAYLNVCSPLHYRADKKVQNATYEEVSTRIWGNIHINVTAQTDLYFSYK